MKASKSFVVSSIVLVAVLMVMALSLGLNAAAAQAPKPQAGSSPEGPTVIAPGAIPVQGRLTDAGGSPLNGTYNLTFRLYDVETLGTALCSDTNSVTVQNGLFNSYIDNCYNDVWGQKLWFSVQVGADPEMTPRQVLYPVAYALSLVPGAEISGTTDPIFTVRSTGAGDGDAIAAYTTGSGEAVTADAVDGLGVIAYSDHNTAIQGYSYNTTTLPALYGCVASTAGACDTARADEAAGVMGYSASDFALYGVGGSSADGGVYGEANYVLGVGVWAENNAGGMALYGETTSSGTLLPTLYLVQHNYTDTSNFIVAANSVGSSPVFRVDGTGNVKQALASDGLVKAGVNANCGTSVGIATRSFNNVNSTAIAVTGTATGQCTINFGFNVFDRYYVATSASSAARFVSCYTSIGSPNELYCRNWDAAGANQDGAIMVMVY